MPRIALACLALVAACSFDADYRADTYLCARGKCPDDLVCDRTQDPPRCVAELRDAAIDSLLDDAMPDARPALLTCGDPHVLDVTGDTVIGTTTGRTNMLQPTCNGQGMFGADAVYRLDVAAGKQVTLNVTASHTVTAYIVQPCASNVGCVGNAFAFNNSPATITVLVNNPQQAFVVVDSTLAAAAGAYTLQVIIN